MHEVVESIRQRWLREMGWSSDTLPGETYFYRDHRGRNYNCGCEKYFELLDACPVQMPHPTVLLGHQE